MSVKLSDAYVVVQKRATPQAVQNNPSLGVIGTPLAEEASKHGHHAHHSHHQGGNQVFVVDDSSAEPLDDSTDVDTDVDPDCGDDGDCDEDRIKIS